MVFCACLGEITQTRRFGRISPLVSCGVLRRASQTTSFKMQSDDTKTSAAARGVIAVGCGGRLCLWSGHLGGINRAARRRSVSLQSGAC